MLISVGTVDLLFYVLFYTPNAYSQMLTVYIRISRLKGKEKTVTYITTVKKDGCPANSDTTWFFYFCILSLFFWELNLMSISQASKGGKHVFSFDISGNIICLFYRQLISVLNYLWNSEPELAALVNLPFNFTRKKIRYFVKVFIWFF